MKRIERVGGICLAARTAYLGMEVLRPRRPLCCGVRRGTPAPVAHFGDMSIQRRV